MATRRLAIGIDAGGSTTRALATAPDADEAGERTDWAGVNLQEVGVSTAAARLVRLVERVIERRGPLATLAVCAGVAGAGRPTDQQALANRLRVRLGQRADDLHLEVVPDAEIALEAAVGAESGIVLIAGTGSIVYGRDESGATIRAGGWGRRIGDPGSGTALGRAGVRAVTDSLEGGPDTRLTAIVCEQWAIDGRADLRETVYTDEFSVRDLAPLVVQAAASGDAVASEILDEQIQELVRQVGWLIEQAGTMSQQLQLTGGLVQNEHFVRMLRRAFADAHPGWSVAPLDREPVEGALLRAQRRAREGSD